MTQPPENLPDNADVARDEVSAAAGVGSLVLSGIEATGIQYRTEHSRSVDDAERYKALETLKEIGLLLPVSSLDIRHGRVAFISEAGEWTVDPTSRNGSNDSGNNNVHNRLALYTLDEATRQALLTELGTGKKTVASDEPWEEHEIAHAASDKEDELSKEEKRQLWADLSADLGVDVYKIVAEDAEATIINGKFDYGQLSPEDKARYVASMQQLLRLLPVIKGMPMGFYNKTNADPALRELLTIRSSRQEQDGLAARLTSQDIEAVAAKTSTNETVVEMLASSANAQDKIFGYPKGAAQFFMSHTEPIEGESHSKPDTPVSTEYIARFLRENHIVGSSGGVDSVTLGERITVISLFDVHKVNTSTHYETIRAVDGLKFDEIGRVLGKEFEGVVVNQHPFLAVLQNAHAKPQKIMEAAKQVGEFGKIFEADAGNWEGFTLEEHTETVLHNFEENYADKLPVGLLAPVRLALVVHDIGKPIAAANNDRRQQKAYNITMAKRYFEALNIDAKTSALLISLVGDGMELATKSAVFRNDRRLQDLRRYGENSLEAFTGTKPDEAMVDGYLDLCEMLATCDGGAYTTMAVTRKAGAGWHRNVGTFNNSFEAPTGLGRRDLALRNRGIAHRSRKAQ